MQDTIYDGTLYKPFNTEIRMPNSSAACIKGTVWEWNISDFALELLFKNECPSVSHTWKSIAMYAVF